MLDIQKYLHHTKSFDDLKRFGINVKYHATEPICILDYDIQHTGNYKMKRECRGLVLNTENFEIIQKPFDRFFNLNENDSSEKFSWESFIIQRKFDGSLIKISNYKNEIFITTRNSFADSVCGESNKTWKNLVLNCLSDEQKLCILENSNLTFLFELCTPYNQIVEQYNDSSLIYLALYDNITGNEIYKNFKEFKLPLNEHYTTVEEMEKYFDELEKNKIPFEGFVLKDINGMRLKFKSKYYLKLHRLSGNGDIKSNKHLIPVILDNEEDEIISYFPFLKDKIQELELKIENLLSHLKITWNAVKEIVNQKEFADTLLKEYKESFSNLLFNMKKNGNINDEDYLELAFRKEKDLIIKILKGVDDE